MANFFSTLSRLFTLIQLLLFFNLIFQSPTALSISFNFSDFGGTRKLNFSNDKFVTSNGVLQLAGSDQTNQSTGTVFYPDDIPFHDHFSGKTADFSTHFSFNLSVLDSADEGDGFSFFIAPSVLKFPNNDSGGCPFVASNCSDLNGLGNQIVLVEFDTYTDDGSSNASSTQNGTSMTWSTKLENGSIAKVWISYNSQTENLSLFFTYLENPFFDGNSSFSQSINLSQVLPDWVTVGFSSSNVLSTEKLSILSWEFNSTDIKPGDGGKSSVVILVAFVVGGFLLAGVVVGALVFYLRKISEKIAKRKEEIAQNAALEREFEQSTGPRKFSYAELVRATNNFSNERKLGQGGFGGVYRGILSGLNAQVAVKRVSKGSKQGKKEYQSEVTIISRLRHRNLVQLVGWCHEKGELLLVYEFMPNGSLDSHLFGRKSTLSWPIRYKIAQGLASALLYLHEEWEQCVVHRDIKSSNVMLDSNFNAKLGDFGLARLADEAQGVKTTALAGTLGYMAPEYISAGKASKESDIFSFGVVALEIGCGRKTVETKKQEDEISLVNWVWELYGNGRVLDAADRGLHMDFDEAQMECLLVVGLWCAHPDHCLRPSIREAIHVLNGGAPLPDLPNRMPVLLYHVPMSATEAVPRPASDAVSGEPQISNSVTVLGR
ncbi:Legume lectin domain [Dillenia turbinata]|uniref:Legume lectin domain n=1 Tax=Dillenia turbinata TaxID=194707 RepID=A0AAN8YXA2_9MAGN